MARIILNLCDVKPCTYPAHREFLVNGERIFVCGESCFVKYWSREYGSWQQSPYLLRASSHTIEPIPSQGIGAVVDDRNNGGFLESKTDSKGYLLAKRSSRPL